MVMVLLAAGFLLWQKHGEWLPHANTQILSESPDGFKNYMTTAWHVAHDSSYVHYEGMNYPYGEHSLFTDNQPILSAAIQWWNRHVSDLRGYSVGVMNLWQVISMMLGALVIFLLLRKLHLPVWYAGIATLGMLFLSPQNNRFDAHFGLSHTWILPLLLFLLCRYEERSSRRYQSLLIGILLFFAAQLHFYNFGVSALFLGIYTAFQILADFRWKVITKRVFHLMVMVVVPFALLNVWIHWSDYYADRPANPFGFTSYIGYWEGVFLPYTSFPMYQWIDENIIHIRRVDAEAQAYVGLVAFAFTLWALFKRRFRLFEPAWDESAYHRVHKRYMTGIFVAGFAMVLLGCGFPFAIPGLDWMVDYLGPFRQFRGLGRFTWIYFYVANLLAFYVFWNWSMRYPVNKTWKAEFGEIWAKLKQFDFKQWPASNLKKWSLVLIPLLILCWEAKILQQKHEIHPKPSPTIKAHVAPQPDHWLNKVDFGRFQALMPLPYYHVGSENIWIDINYPLFKKVQYTAFHTGVPDMGVFMSRTSIGRMVKSVQWSLDPGETPGMLGDLPDNRPIALMIEPEKWEEVKKRYAHLIAKATPMYEGPELRILSLVPDSVRVYARERAALVTREANAPDLKDVGQGWKSADLNGGWMFYDGYDSQTDNKYIFQGKGAATGIMSDTVMIWNKPIPTGTYRLSLWIKVTEDMGMTHEVKVIQNNLADGHQIHFRHEGLRFYIETIVDGWALFNMEFSIYEDNSSTQIFLEKKGVHTQFWYDEVMIKPANANLYRQTPGWVAKNNQWFRQQ